MTLQIDTTSMRSDHTAHHAERIVNAPHWDGEYWRVSWLQDRKVTRTEAVTAMTIAETVAEYELPPGDRMWMPIAGWADELGLTAQDAVRMVKEVAATP